MIPNCWNINIKDLTLRRFQIVYLINESGVKPPEGPGKFIVKLNEANIATRYPEDLTKLQQDYTQPVANEMIAKTTEVMQWIKSQF